MTVPALLTAADPFAQTAAVATSVLPPWLETVTAVAGAIVTIMLAILLLAAVPVLLMLLRRLRRGTDEVNRVLTGAAPLLRDATALVTELRGIAGSVRADMGTVHGVVLDAEGRYRELADATERRLAELGRLADVVKSGVEDAVVSVTAVTRGVRAGAEALVGDHNREHDRESDHETEDLIEVGATHNGNDRAGSPERQARPRVRPQRGGT